MTEQRPGQLVPGASPRCVCGCSNLKPMPRPTFGPRRLFECPECTTVQLFPLPAFEGSLESIYQQESYLSAIRPDEYRGYYQVVEEFLRIDAATGRDISLLDFGAGKCFYQKFFLEDGYRDVHSLEINRHAVRYAREDLGLRHVYSSAADLPGGYDVVISNQVFEHLENPIQMLETTIASLLRDNGLVCLTLPNWTSANRRVLGKRWLGYSPEDHIWFFSEESIRKVLAGSRYFVVEQTCVRSAVGKPYDGFRPRGLLRKLAYSLVMKRSERIGRGDQLIVLLRKRVKAGASSH